MPTSLTLKNLIDQFLYITDLSNQKHLNMQKILQNSKSSGEMFREIFSKIGDLSTESTVLPPGGHIGEVLTKQSDTENAATWESKNFTYIQGVPSDLWVINHGKNGYPSVIVTDTTGRRVWVSEKYNSYQEVQINFARPTLGMAFLKF